MVDGFQRVLLVTTAVVPAPLGVPRTTVIAFPALVIVEFVKAIEVLVYPVLPSRTTPSGSWLVFVASQICTRSPPPPPAFSSWSVTGVAVPSHPARIEFGSIGSLNVNVIESPVSARPTIPPAWLVVVSEDPVGLVVST